MSKNAIRELRKIIRKKYPCFLQKDIHIGKYKEGRTHCRIYISYDYDEKRIEAINKLKDLFIQYNNIIEMDHYEAARTLSIVFPVEMLECIKGFIKLNC